MEDQFNYSFQRKEGKVALGRSCETIQVLGDSKLGMSL